MKLWMLGVLGVALSAIVGCRTDPAIPLLERELYRKDKEIRRLQWQIEDIQDSADSCQDRSSSRDRIEDREPESRSRKSRRGSNGSSGVTPPVLELPGTPSDKVPDALKAPAGSIPSGIPEVPKGIQGPSPTGANDDGPALEGDSEELSSRPPRVSMAAGSAAAAPVAPSGSSDQVAAVVLDRMLTGGISSGDRSGDQGLLVVVEMRDAAGRPITAPADVNVAVLDPALKGEAARVARWDFTAAETASLFRRTGAGGAIHLAMGWPETPPKHNKLHLFVRYITADGRTLEVNHPIEIALPGDRTARWTPAETPRSANPPTERVSASDSWRRSEIPTERISEPARMASRPAEPKSDRPVWSLDRR